MFSLAAATETFDTSVANTAKHRRHREGEVTVAAVQLEEIVLAANRVRVDAHADEEETSSRTAASRAHSSIFTEMPAWAA